MKTMTKKELVKQIKTIYNNAQNQINKLISDNDFTYFGSTTVDGIKEIKEEYDWITKPFDKFFKRFNSLTYCSNLTLMLIANILNGEKSRFKPTKLDDYLMSPEEKQAFINQFDKSNQDRIEKQKKIDNLLAKIESEEKKIDKMKDEYYELTDGKQYHI